MKVAAPEARAHGAGKWVTHGLARSQVKKHRSYFVQRLLEATFRQQPTQRTLLDWLRVEYAIEKPRNKLLAVAELDSGAWVGEVRRKPSRTPAALNMIGSPAPKGSSI
jgi:hypothetical protein